MLTITFAAFLSGCLICALHTPFLGVWSCLRASLSGRPSPLGQCVLSSRAMARPVGRTSVVSCAWARCSVLLTPGHSGASTTLPLHSAPVAAPGHSMLRFNSSSWFSSVFVFYGGVFPRLLIPAICYVAYVVTLYQFCMKSNFGLSADGLKFIAGATTFMLIFRLNQCYSRMQRANKMLVDAICGLRAIVGVTCANLCTAERNGQLSEESARCRVACSRCVSRCDLSRLEPYACDLPHGHSAKPASKDYFAVFSGHGFHVDPACATALNCLRRLVSTVGQLEGVTSIQSDQVSGRRRGSGEFTGSRPTSGDLCQVSIDFDRLSGRLDRVSGDFSQFSLISSNFLALAQILESLSS